MKRCSKCKEIKGAENFYNSASAKDGLTSACKTCTYTPDDKERSFEYARKRRSDDPVAFLLSAAASRARRDGVPFDIASSDVKQPTRCPVFGMKLIYDGTGRGYGAKEDAASLDRIHPEKGYVRGNVQVVSWKANRTKAHLTPTEIVRMAKFYSKFL